MVDVLGPLSAVWAAQRCPLILLLSHNAPTMQHLSAQKQDLEIFETKAAACASIARGETGVGSNFC